MTTARSCEPATVSVATTLDGLSDLATGTVSWPGRSPEAIDFMTLLNATDSAARKFVVAPQINDIRYTGQIRQDGSIGTSTASESQRPVLWVNFRSCVVAPNRPPGDDQHREGVTFSLDGSAVRFAVEHEVTNCSPVPWPCCSFAEAFRTVVASNVSAEARFRVRYPDRLHISGALPNWTFEVDGHPEMRRVVDGHTCKLLPARDRP